MGASGNKFIDGNGRAVPPIYAHVVIYFIQAGSDNEQASEFFDYFQAVSWRNKSGSIIRNWKTRAWKWIWYDNK